MRQTERTDAAQQALTVLATGLHARMRACDGEVCLELLILLSDGERSVSDLARMMQLGMPAVSARLAGMKQSGLVVVRRERNWRFYALASCVKVKTREPFRIIKIRAAGGGELRLAVPLKLMELLEAKWKAAEAHAAANPETAEPVLPPLVPQVREVAVNEIAEWVALKQAKRAKVAAKASGMSETKDGKGK